MKKSPSVDGAYSGSRKIGSAKEDRRRKKARRDRALKKHYKKVQCMPGTDLEDLRKKNGGGRGKKERWHVFVSAGR